MKKMFLFLILTAALTFAQNQTPVASNLTFAQRTDGSYKVDIYYDVTDADGDTLTIAIQASNDAGTTWDFAIISVTGDVGTNITSGTQKHIVWDFDADHTEYYSDQIKLKIIADDGFDACGGVTTVNYSGKTYNTVQIGNQCWLKENLDVGVIATSFNQTDNNIIEKACYNGDSLNCEIYGGLYQWAEAVQYENGATNSTNPIPSFDGLNVQGICPPGWHIPSYTEFQELKDLYNNANDLKDIGQGTGGGVGTNRSGFTALLSGLRSNTVGYGGLGDRTGFWTTQTYGYNKSIEFWLNGNNSSSNFYHDYKTHAFSIRCLKD